MNNEKYTHTHTPSLLQLHAARLRNFSSFWSNSIEKGEAFSGLLLSTVLSPFCRVVVEAVVVERVVVVVVVVVVVEVVVDMVELVFWVVGPA